MLIWHENICIVRFDENNPNYPNNGRSLFLRQSLQTMILNKSKHHYKQVYMHRINQQIMNYEFEFQEYYPTGDVEM